MTILFAMRHGLNVVLARNDLHRNHCCDSDHAIVTMLARSTKPSKASHYVLSRSPTTHSGVQLFFSSSKPNRHGLTAPIGQKGCHLDSLTGASYFPIQNEILVAVWLACVSTASSNTVWAQWEKIGATSLMEAGEVVAGHGTGVGQLFSLCEVRCVRVCMHARMCACVCAHACRMAVPAAARVPPSVTSSKRLSKSCARLTSYKLHTMHFRTSSDSLCNFKDASQPSNALDYAVERYEERSALHAVRSPTVQYSLPHYLMCGPPTAQHTGLPTA